MFPVHWPLHAWYSPCSDWSSSRRVSPFRHLRINGHLLLPMTFSQTYHVFLRLLVPRYPPCALISLTITLLHSVATVVGLSCSPVCNLRYLCLLLNDFSFFSHLSMRLGCLEIGMFVFIQTFISRYFSM